MSKQFNGQKHSYFKLFSLFKVLIQLIQFSISIFNVLLKNAASNIEQILGDSTPQSSSCTATYHPSRKLSKLDKPDMRDTAGEFGTSS